jgi:hypothetical protein
LEGVFCLGEQCLLWTTRKTLSRASEARAFSFI